MIENFQSQDIYIDIHPYHETMIWLDNLVNHEQGYINCSRIKSSYQESSPLMIATQGPMKNTVESFWRLVMQENVSLVITLAEKIGKDCAVYFPMQKSLEERYGKCHV